MKKIEYNRQISDLGEAARLLNQVKSEADLRERIDQISRQFIGRPYFNNPLGGGPDQKESLVYSLQGFDCVTYVEEVLALALSKNVEEFTENLRKIRYADGKVEWSQRNHYMVDWLTENEAGGFITNITDGAGAIEKTRLLNVVSGLPAKTAVFSYYPKRIWKSIAGEVETGDIILFASAKKNLDVFHTGFLIRRNGEILLRHAARRRAVVLELRIEEFLADHRMSGLILVRPKERKPKRKQ